MGKKIRGYPGCNLTMRLNGRLAIFVKGTFED